MRDELERRRAFRTEMSARDRRLGITFDADDLAVAMVNELTTSDTAVRTDRARHFRVAIFRRERARGVAHRVGAGAVAAIAKLADQRPFQKEIDVHGQM